MFSAWFTFDLLSMAVREIQKTTMWSPWGRQAVWTSHGNWNSIPLINTLQWSQICVDFPLNYSFCGVFDLRGRDHYLIVLALLTEFEKSVPFLFCAINFQGSVNYSQRRLPFGDLLRMCCPEYARLRDWSSNQPIFQVVRSLDRAKRAKPLKHF